MSTGYLVLLCLFVASVAVPKPNECQLVLSESEPFPELAIWDLEAEFGIDAVALLRNGSISRAILWELLASQNYRHGATRCFAEVRTIPRRRRLLIAARIVQRLQPRFYFFLGPLELIMMDGGDLERDLRKGLSPQVLIVEHVLAHASAEYVRSIEQRLERSLRAREIFGGHPNDLLRASETKYTRELRDLARRDNELWNGSIWYDRLDVIKKLEISWLKLDAWNLRTLRLSAGTDPDSRVRDAARRVLAAD